MDTQRLQEKHRRSSAFLEIGLEGTDPILDDKIRNERPKLQMKSRQSNVSGAENCAVESAPPTPMTSSQTTPNAASSIHISRIPFMHMALVVALLAIAFPTIYVPLAESRSMPAVAQAGVIVPRSETPATLPAKRQTTGTDICKRWAGQSALVNGTLYYYGGRATTTSDQASNQWSKSKND